MIDIEIEIKANSTDGAKIRETKLVANDNSMLFFPKLIIWFHGRQMTMHPPLKEQCWCKTMNETEGFYR